MCGIAGFMRCVAPDATEGLLRRMGEVISHRGPDARGEYLDQEVGLAHRRLSILDLSPLGVQPMHSLDGRYVIVFNGEIYNFLELRQELEREGVFFKSRTDTEVILALYARDGVGCLEKMNGMFAFALWDRELHTLVLARDRIGKKPLYYYHAGGDRLAFASEIKSILLLPGVAREVEPTALVDFLSYQYIPEPKTVYRSIYKLPPAHYLELRAGGEPRLGCYWDVEFNASPAGEYQDAEDRLLELLQDATSCRMVSDVPLGAFLSGGVDSSAVVALMARTSPEPVKTCTIGFSDPRHDESPFAREIAQLYNTSHSEYRDEERYLDTVSLLPKFFDEPFGDSSAVPTYHVSRLARRAVTVALAGDGGDESFGGYAKYAVELKEQLARQLVPRPLLSLMHAVTGSLGQGTLVRKARSLTGSALKDPGRAFFRTNSCLEDGPLRELLAAPVKAACQGYDPAGHTLKYWDRMRGKDHAASMLYTDLKTYLPGDILVKVDRMSMANSLEVRAPFLDYRIIEFAASLPSDWKLKGDNKKIILRSAFQRLLPRGVLDRKKHGFTVPLDSWFRGELRPLAEQAFLHQPALGEFLDLVTVGRLWEEHQKLRCDHGTVLWNLLMLSLWQKEYLL